MNPFLLVAFFIIATFSERGHGNKTYHNPLFEPAFPDPTFLHDRDGYFYAYGTEHLWTKGCDVQTPILRSRDMIKWEYIGNAWTHKPEWKAKGDFWAPQIVFNETTETYFLFYAFSVWGDSKAGVGVGKSKHPYGPFEDMGKILDRDTASGGNTIDPFYIQTKSGDQKQYLFWGSFGRIYGRELGPDMKTLVGDEFRIAGDDWEGSYILEKNGKFFYIGSSGGCCDGRRSNYHLTVAIADNIRGPYIRRDGRSIWNDATEGTMVVHSDPTVGWVGPGHNGEIITDDLGRYFILYHAIYYYADYLPDQPVWGPATRRCLMMDEILWDEDGWPYIEGFVSSDIEKRAPYFKERADD